MGIKKKTLAGIFLRYVVLFCLSMLLSFAAICLLLLGAAAIGLTRPANYAEVILSKNEEAIRGAGLSVEELIPDDCTYGIYSDEGTWLAGSFSEQERRNAWEHYKKGRIYADNGTYYRFIPMDSGGVCIVNYRIQMRYSLDVLNNLLPAPEPFGFFLLVVFFVLNMLLLSRRFAKGLRAELGKLSAVTDKIRENDLEFEAAPSEIREIHEVMDSLTRMKEALKDSLKKQWDMEKQKQEQLSALAHDIKTPLTVIRGNAELLLENVSGQEDRECASYILSNVQEMEQYLAAMRSVLHGLEQKTELRTVSCKELEELEELFVESARQIALAEKLPVSFDVTPSSIESLCCVERILRAWSNLVSNGAEHTDPQKGIHIRLCPQEIDGQTFLTAAVRDFGKGFTEKDLRHADEEFYSGDASRHGRSHQGMGLFIAKQFLEEQGGFLKYYNCADGMGAEVSLWIACRRRQQHEEENLKG